MMKRDLLAVINFLFLLNQNGCHAFRSSAAVAVGRRPLSTPTFGSTSCLRAHQEGLASASVVGGDDAVSRRRLFSIGAASLLPLLTAAAAATTPLPAYAIAGGVATTTTARSTARIQSYPGIESIEPLYEFKLSIDAIVAGVEDPKNWPYIQKRLESFFGGFIINEKNYFTGVGLQYANDIVYDKNELPDYVLLDKEARFDALDNTMKNLESLKSVLATGTPEYAAAVEDLAKASQSSLQSFFAMIPEEDVRAVEELFVHVRKADADGDGKLSEGEIVYLSPGEQAIWKRRIGKFG